MATVFAISFASIIFSGPLSVSLDRGIGVCLLGSAIMAGLGAVLFTYRGTIIHPQDVTAILLATGAASVAVAGAGLSDDALFATVIAMIGVATILSGVACIVFGRMRLAFVARYMPYPVLGGFLAATGYLLSLGGIGVMLDAPLSIWNLGPLTETAELIAWLPWTVAGLLIVWLTRRTGGDLVLPLAVTATAALFYGVVQLSGFGLTAALDRGLLLGPFPEASFLSDLSPALLKLVDWPLIAAQAPLIIAIVAMTVLGGLLNITGINHVIGHSGDINADLRATGYTNVVSGAVGGLMGYPTIGETVLGHRLGLWAAVAGGSVAALNFAAAWFGAGLLELLPRGLFGMLLLYLGADLLWTWLIAERQRLPARDFGIVVCILVVAATIGFLEALAVGLLVSMTLFILSYAQFDFVRLQTTLKNRRSMVERSDPARAQLTDRGDEVLILELSGMLFFGTAARLGDRIERTLQERRHLARVVIVDFRRVRDLDTSAAISLGQLFDRIAADGIDVRLSGLDDTTRARIDRIGALPVTFHDTLDEAVLAVEDTLLGAEAHGADGRNSFLGQLSAAHPGFDVTDHVPSVAFGVGDRLLSEGNPSREIFVLTSGEATAIVDADGEEVVVARFLPGALIGEMAFYTGEPRSASVRAETAVTALRIDGDLLTPDGPLPPEVVMTIHRLAAATVSQRLIRMNRLLRDAEM